MLEFTQKELLQLDMAHTTRFLRSHDMYDGLVACKEVLYTRKCTVFIQSYISHEKSKSETCAIPKSQRALLVASQQVLAVIGYIYAHDFVPCQLWHEKWLSLLLCERVEDLDIARGVTYKEHGTTLGSKKFDTVYRAKVCVASLLKQLVR